MVDPPKKINSTILSPKHFKQVTKMSTHATAYQTIASNFLNLKEKAFVLAWTVKGKITSFFPSFCDKHPMQLKPNCLNTYVEKKMNKNFSKSFLTQTYECRGLTPHVSMDSDTSIYLLNLNIIFISNR